MLAQINGCILEYHERTERERERESDRKRYDYMYEQQEAYISSIYDGLFVTLHVSVPDENHKLYFSFEYHRILYTSILRNSDRLLI